MKAAPGEGLGYKLAKTGKTRDYRNGGNCLMSGIEKGENKGKTGPTYICF